MTELYAITDNLIRNAKRDRKLSEVRFVKAYRKAQAEHPVSGFLGVVNFRKVDCEMNAEGEIYKTELEITLYKCESESGEELGITALNLIKALQDADKDGFIANMSMGAIEYDSNNGAICRNVKAQLSAIYSDGVMKKYPTDGTQNGGTSVPAVVYKNGIKLDGVLSFSAREEFTQSKSYYEILSDEPWLSTAQQKEYIIEIIMSEDSYGDFESGFVLTAEYEDGSISYKGCKVISSELTVNDSESYKKKFKITATERVSAQ